ncbi:MAG: hypothetical protein PHR61_02955 [Candidatus Absconditabacteria bacterium]|nr:hypothetical protein [Candidatus Absconditabacteria bacterium]
MLSVKEMNHNEYQKGKKLFIALGITEKELKELGVLENLKNNRHVTKSIIEDGINICKNLKISDIKSIQETILSLFFTLRNTLPQDEYDSKLLIDKIILEEKIDQ